MKPSTTRSAAEWSAATWIRFSDVARPAAKRDGSGAERDRQDHRRRAGRCAERAREPQGHRPRQRQPRGDPRGVPPAAGRRRTADRERVHGREPPRSSRGGRCGDRDHRQRTDEHGGVHPGSDRQGDGAVEILRVGQQRHRDQVASHDTQHRPGRSGQQRLSDVRPHDLGRGEAERLENADAAGRRADRAGHDRADDQDGQEQAQTAERQQERHEQRRLAVGLLLHDQPRPCAGDRPVRESGRDGVPHVANSRRGPGVVEPVQHLVAAGHRGQRRQAAGRHPGVRRVAHRPRQCRRR